jgi:hypothetical protein
MIKKRLWSEIAGWTFRSDLAHHLVGGSEHWKSRRRQGYAFPAEPTLLGEVLSRGFAEGV